MAKSKSECTLNEKDTLTDMLNSEKALVKLYGTAMTESSCKSLRTLLRSQFADTAEDQLTVFELMKQHDYYMPKPAEKMMIDEKKENFSSVLKQMAQ